MPSDKNTPTIKRKAHTEMLLTTIALRGLPLSHPSAVGGGYDITHPIVLQYHPPMPTAAGCAVALHPLHISLREHLKRIRQDAQRAGLSPA